MKRQCLTASGHKRDSKQWCVQNNREINRTHMKPELVYRTVHAFANMHQAANVMSIVPFPRTMKVLPHRTIFIICVRCMTIMRNLQRCLRRAILAPCHPPRLGERREGGLSAPVFISHRLHPQLWPILFRLVSHMRNK